MVSLDQNAAPDDCSPYNTVLTSINVPSSSTTFSSVVSRDSVRVALTIAALNKLDILACDEHNAYLITLCRENIWTFSGPEFGEKEGTLVLCKKMALYGLKSSGASFQYKIAGVLRENVYLSTKGYPMYGSDRR